MAKKRFNTGNEYTVCYSDMRGVDFSSGEEASGKRYAYLENMYRDYDGEGGSLIESIPGFRKIAGVGARVHKLYRQKNDSGKEFVIVHARDKLYRFAFDERDTLTELLPLCTVADRKSCGFSFGGDFFVIDGESMIRISSAGDARRVGILDGEATPYEPTTHIDGIEYRQRNLINKNFKEIFHITSADLVTEGTEALYYRITDRENKLCRLAGIDPDYEPITRIIHVPSYTTIGNEKYKVTEIEEKAFFNNSTVSSVKMNDGLIRIGASAFEGCSALEEVFCPRSLEFIDERAFALCERLRLLYLGEMLKKIGKEALFDCNGLFHINYAKSEYDFKQIENEANTDDISISPNNPDYSVNLEIPIYTPASTVREVKVNGAAFSFKANIRGGRVPSVTLFAQDKRMLEGKTVTILASALDEPERFPTAGSLITKLPEKMTPEEAVFGCTVCESFDGRIFLSGNPRLPNTVIYSERDDEGLNSPCYFGELNYFDDGVGSFPVISLLSASDSLAVFKESDDGGGSIFYHTPKITDSDLIPKVYPTSYIHSGIAATGDSISFFDDPVFISPKGLSALEKKAINLDRSIACRSHNVNALLLTENPKDISLAIWRGYLAICAGGRIYLADSRKTYKHESGSTEYEWFFLTGIGTYENATRVYRYSQIAPDGYLTRTPGEKAPGEIYSVSDGGGNLIFYELSGGEKYAVYPTEEYAGGDFKPATALLSVRGENLIFGTENGDICIFNDDKRGLAPKRLSDDENFIPEEYLCTMKRRLHPDFYSFCDHAPKYALKTAYDNCGIPHLTKSTEKHSLTLKCKLGGAGKLLCEVGTDKSGYLELCEIPGSALDFSNTDFSTFTLSTDDTVTLPIGEKEKGWIEKQIAVYSDSYRSPIGVYSITYRFFIKGRIKK